MTPCRTASGREAFVASRVDRLHGKQCRSIDRRRPTAVLAVASDEGRFWRGRSDEHADAGDAALDDQGVHLAGALVGVERIRSSGRPRQWQAGRASSTSSRASVDRRLEPAPTVAACPAGLLRLPLARRRPSSWSPRTIPVCRRRPVIRGSAGLRFFVAGECVLADRADSSPSGGLFQQRPRRPTTETVSPIAAPMSDPTTTSPG